MSKGEGEVDKGEGEMGGEGVGDEKWEKGRD